MIVYPASFLLTAPVPLNNARIGYQTWTEGLQSPAIEASSEKVSGPSDAPLHPDTFEYWEPFALPAFWQVDLGTLRDVDYIGVAGHNLGSSHNSIQARLSEDENTEPRLTVPGVAGNYASTPDSVLNSVTTDIDVVVKVHVDDWTPAVEQLFYGKGDTGSQRSWLFGVNTGGNLIAYFSSNGTAWLGGAAYASTVPTGFVDGSVNFIRFTRASGSGNLNFYSSPDGVSWTQIGTQVATTAGALFDSTGLLRVNGPGELFVGAVYLAKLFAGINGALVARFDPAEGVTDALTLVSGTGETYTINRAGLNPARLINTIFGGEVAPIDDSPIMFMDVSRRARFVELHINPVGFFFIMPRIAVVYAGKVLAMQRCIYGGHAPITMSRQTQLKQPMSRGGQFLGQSFRRLGVSTMADFQHLTAPWVRANFDPFIKAARKRPYFFAWRPQSYPTEVGYVWTPDDIAPSNTGQRDHMQVSWKMQGIGND